MIILNLYLCHEAFSNDYSCEIAHFLKKNNYVHKYFCLHICLCTISVPDAYGGLKRVSDALELEIQMAVSCLVNVGNKARFPGRAVQVSHSDDIVVYN